MQIAFPFRLDGRGRTALSGEDDHLRELVEQVLFTAQGERVNRPTFGAGLAQVAFGPASGEVAGALTALLQGALQQSLGDVLSLESVDVEAVDAALVVSVQYRRRGETAARAARFAWRA